MLSTEYISIQWKAQLVYSILIRWITIYLVDCAIQRWKNWEENYKSSLLLTDKLIKYRKWALRLVAHEFGLKTGALSTV